MSLYRYQLPGAARTCAGLPGLQRVRRRSSTGRASGPQRKRLCSAAADEVQRRHSQWSWANGAEGSTVPFADKASFAPPATETWSTSDRRARTSRWYALKPDRWIQPQPAAPGERR